MRIALAVDGKIISQHFGHCEGFEVVDIEGNKEVNREFVQNPGHKPGLLPRLLNSKEVSLVIAGGMGGTAQALFNQNGIEVITGAMGNVDDVINSFIKGNLEHTAEVCERHEHQGEGIGAGNCNH